MRPAQADGPNEAIPFGEHKAVRPAVHKTKGAQPGFAVDPPIILHNCQHVLVGGPGKGNAVLDHIRGVFGRVKTTLTILL